MRQNRSCWRSGNRRVIRPAGLGLLGCVAAGWYAGPLSLWVGGLALRFANGCS